MTEIDMMILGFGVVCGAVGAGLGYLFTSCTPCKGELPKGTRVRQLIDGKWVAEVKRGLIFKRWYGIDRGKSTTWLRRPGSQYYLDCRCNTREDAIKSFAGLGY